MTASPRLGFTYLTSGQATPETAVNEIAAYLESGSGHFIFKDRDLSAPPGSPANGDCYLVAATGSGAWTGHTGDIAYYLNTAWVFVEVIEGYTAWVNDENVFIGYDGAAWNILAVASAGTFLQSANNLSDVANAGTSRTNLGLGTAATLASDTDATLAANSNTRLATQAAVKTYVDNAVTGLLDLKGTTDCSANPNYPAASKGDYYVVTVAGKIGGASGSTVAVGDVYFATADNAGGTQAAVGSSWDILVHASVAAGGGLLAVNNLSDVANAATAGANIRPVESLIIACSDETTALTTGTGKVTFRMPYAFTVTAVRASLVTAQATDGAGGIFTVDINESGTTILSTKLTIDNTEKTSTTAATPPVISDTTIADDAEMTVDIDQIGDGTAKGLKITLIGHRT